MGSRVFWRRSATAVGVYTATALGLVATVIAARLLGPRDFGIYALVIATAGFFQVLLDSSVEEAAVKYGFRYEAREEWGKLRRLFRIGVIAKLAGGLAAGALVAAIAPAAGAIFGSDQLLAPLLLASFLPALQGFETVAGAVLMVRGRYDLRGWLMTSSMAFRLAGVAVGARYGVAEAVGGLLAGQVAAAAVASAAGLAAFRRFPHRPHEPIGPERGELKRFVLQSAATTALVSARAWLAPVLVGVVSNPLQVGYFRAAQAPLTGFASLSAPVRLVLMTEQTRDFEGGRIGLVYRLLGRYVAATTAATIVAVPVFWWLMPDLVRLVFTADFLPAVDAMRLIAVAGGIALVFGWTKPFPVSIGRPGLRIVAHGAETVVLVPLLVLLAAPWGATGAAAAVLASTVVFAATWVVLLGRLRREHAALASLSEVPAR
jgi:O-antigen/teichoic acid export membrane protein